MGKTKICYLENWLPAIEFYKMFAVFQTRCQEFPYFPSNSLQFQFFQKIFRINCIKCYFAINQTTLSKFSLIDGFSDYVNLQKKGLCFEMKVFIPL